jgi:adenylate cyclase
VARADEQENIARLIDEEANRAVVRGTIYSSLFGFGSAVAITIAQTAGALSGLWSPAIMAALGGLYSLLLFVFARRNGIVGWRRYTSLLPLVSFPSSLFVLSHFLTPGGAATFLNGPFAHLYLVLVAMTGFFFDPLLSRVAGVLAAAEYIGCALLAGPGLARITSPDPHTQQDLQALPIYLFKGSMMVFGGFVVGALAQAGRRIIVRALTEEREKTAISRLFAQYVSPEVKEKIIREKAGMRGERKRVVLLFSDIRGFTAWSERADPEAVVSQLNQYFDAMVGAITRHGGVIDKFIGDAVMAVFGGVLELDEPAAAALDAAREMRRRLAALNERWARGGGETIDHGIGLHAGRVVQGTIGSEERKEFTVIGDPVNTCARLESLTREQNAPILVSAAFVDALPPLRRDELRLLGNFKLKGKEQTIDVYAPSDAISSAPPRSLGG